MRRLAGCPFITLGFMSISNHFDAYLEARGLKADVEVIPDHACQEFLPQPGMNVRVVKDREELSHAEEVVRDLLG